MALSTFEQLADLLGRDAILPPGLLGDYAIDGLIPQVVVQPVDRSSIGPALRWASDNQITVFPRGGGTQLTLGNLPSRVDLVLDLSRCHRILDHQPADLTATVEAGITLQALQEELARQGQFVPLEAPLPERATIGGILAANTSGPSRFAYGLAREWLIGIRVVSAGGVETKAGGKVVKNVTGYDLNKLYAGSLGTLGVIVEATIKLLPLPAESGTLVASFPSTVEGLGAAQALAHQAFLPQALEVIDSRVARRLEVAPPLSAGAGAAVAFFSGRARTVQRKLDQATRLLRDRGAAQVERFGDSTGRWLLQRLSDLGWNRDTAPFLGLKVNVPPSAVGQMMERSGRIGELGHPPGVIADVGFGGVRLLWWAEGVSGWNGETVVTEIIGPLRSLARGLGGSVVVEHCPLSVKQQIDVWGDEFQGMEIMRRIKQQIDPLGILNPGRFVGRI